MVRVMAADDAQPRPRPGLPKTIGILNIVFGALLLLCIPCGAGYLALMANMGRLLDYQNAEIQARIEAKRKARLDELAAREKAAASEEQKAQIRAERSKILSEPGPPQVSTMNLEAMTRALQDRRIIAYYLLDFGSGWLINLVMLVAGIGLVRLKEWGRRLALGVAAVKIARLVVVSIALVGYVVPISIETMRRGIIAMGQQAGAEGGGADPHHEAEKMAAEFVQAMWRMNIAYTVGLLVIGSIYPAVVLAVLTRPAARAACRGSGPPRPRGAEPDQ
ncbi:MAG: hypothetical protein IRY99_22360 [Isosphaeraceae bacterium]|nr:hypothetical protein [Isosphaeraceae bacterium]